MPPPGAGTTATGNSSQTQEQAGGVTAGDPVNVATGNLSEEVVDYTTAGQNPLALTRYYNSFQTTTQEVVLLGEFQPFAGATSLGGHWRTNFDRFVVPQNAAGTSIIVERPTGRALTFTQTSNGGYASDTDVALTLFNAGSTWSVTDTDDSTETYTTESSGVIRLVSITQRGGYTQTLSYNGDGQIAEVKDSYGRTLKFHYTGALLTSVTTPDNTTIGYTYGASGMNGSTLDLLTGVTYPTKPATSLTYLYQNNSYPFDPFQLTGIKDEDGNLFASWTYDPLSRVLTSQHAGGAGLTTFTYNDTDNSRTVLNAVGEQETEQFAGLQNVAKVTEIDRASTQTTAAASRLFTYDSNGYLASATDWNGNLTSITNDSRGLPTKIVEASGTSVARTTLTSWNPTYHVPDSIATSGLTQTFTFNAQGLPTSRTDASPGLKRVWSFVWNDALLASVTGPRTDVPQTTSFTYNTSGALASITNALGQTTQITSSTEGGRPLTIVDPNGVTTKLTYSPRQWPLSQTIVAAGGNFITSLTYDAAGNLTETRLPDGSYLANAYDAAHRLIMTANPLGDTITYKLDGLGDRTADTISRSGIVAWQHADSFDALGRAISDVGGAGQTTTIAYDSNGNPLMVTDPLTRVTTQGFDALNRVTTIVDPAKGTTSISYDAHDRITRVIAPNGAATTYAYDGFGRLLKRVSPDTGTTSYAYDLADNLLQSTDASGVATNHSYDALNRVLTTAYPADTSENVTLAYDQAGHGFGVGHLTGVADAVGSLSLTYDERGNEVGETRTSGSVSLATSYAYDAASRVAAIGYPSGNVASYIRNKAGEVTSVKAQIKGASSARSIVSGVTYLPFGPPGAWVWGNGLSDARTYDTDYRLYNLADGSVQNLTYSYDPADHVGSVTDGVNSANTQSFGYDMLDHLTEAIGAYGVVEWTYDGVGNRLTQVLSSGASSSYAYLTHRNVLSSITSSGQTTRITTSAAGNTLAITPSSGSAVNLSFDQAERLAGATVGGTQVANYVYDAFGQRFSKVLASGGSLFQYDFSGHLLEETGLSGSLNTDTIYLNGVPVADITPNATFFLHADRLGTPQVATTTTKAIAWQATYQPFGTNTGGSGLFTQNLRFPGQYADKETGFNQNGFRDYNPALGRYLESDPIGLAGGVNTFGYVEESPSNATDQLGLYDNFFGIPPGPLNYGNTPGISQSFAQPPFYPISENQPGIVLSGTVCNRICASITINEANIYLGAGVGTRGASCSAVYANNMQAYSNGGTFQSGLKSVTGGLNSESGAFGLQLSTSPGAGAAWIYSLPISTIFSNVPKPYPKARW